MEKRDKKEVIMEWVGGRGRDVKESDGRIRERGKREDRYRGKREVRNVEEEKG